MNILVILAGLAFFCFVMWDFSRRLPPQQGPQLRRWFTGWMFKGLVVPVYLWVFFNSGISVRIPPLMPAVEFAKMNGTLTETMEHVITLGLFVVSTYWAAVTLGWLLLILERQTPDRCQFHNCVLIWSVLLAPVVFFAIWASGWRFAGFAATIWLLPTLQHALALEPDQKRAPIYSRAIAAINFDRHEEAEQAVIHELESCEDDFDGWMMLAELYANQFHDLPAAQELLRETCEHSATTPSQFAVAHHRLADWRLKLAQDPDGARAALEEICRRYPRSHLDRMARLRINQMPASREEWIAQQGVKKIHLHTLHGSPSHFSVARRATISHQEAFARSQQCVLRLQKNADDISAREELARLWAEELDQVEMAVEQLNLLLAMPGIPSAKPAQWLGLLASWHLRYPQDFVAARAVMERLIRHYPQSPQAFAAQRRLNLLDLEAKIRQSAESRHETHA
jgi:tetratricopeptide (TPR) repeat protein